MTDSQKKSLISSLEVLVDKYKNNDYMMNRLELYMKNILPTTLDSLQATFEEREERKQTLTKNTEKFIEKFMITNNNYYCPVNRLFLKYDGIHFIGHGEDDIQHNILSAISRERNLSAWKYKINNVVLKKIKMKTPLHAIPESFTIQHTINMLTPYLFKSRYSTKHFLTILGDNILGKNSNIVYITSPRAKEIIQEIGLLWNTHFGQNNIVQNIKYKYYDHDYSNCRLLSINTEYLSTYKSVASEISKHIIDLLSVSAHYSRRYSSADKYLVNCADTAYMEHVLYLTRNTSTEIVNNFITECVEDCTGSFMETKNMIFIWKKYLKEKNLPNIIFHEPLKVLLKEKIKFDDSKDAFVNVTSTSIPLVASFITFWDTTCIIDNDNDSDIEIDELCFLFKKWSNRLVTNLTETFLLDLIRHFYPCVDIESEKYLLNIRNNLWDKRSDVLNSLEFYRIETIEKKGITTLSMAYQYYIEKYQSVQQNYKVSKRYFERVATEELGEKLDEDGIICYD